IFRVPDEIVNGTAIAMEAGMTPLRIVDVTDFYSERGGVRAHLELKGQTLCRLGHSHTVVAPGPTDADDCHTPAREDGSFPTGSQRIVRLKGPTLPYDTNYHLMWRVHETRQLVTGLRPHVIEVNSPYLAAWTMRKVQPQWGNIKTFLWHTDFIDTYVRHFAGSRSEPGSASSLTERMTAPLWSFVRIL